MKTLVVLLLFLLSIDMNAQTNDQETDAVKALLLRLDGEWNQALLRHDLQYWLEALSPEIVIVDEKGRLHGLQGQIGYASTTYFSSIVGWQMAVG